MIARKSAPLNPSVTFASSSELMPADKLTYTPVNMNLIPNDISYMSSFSIHVHVRYGNE